MNENKNIDKKSLRFLREGKTDWRELAKDCVSFANAQGGFIDIGIEDNEQLPPEDQMFSDRNLPEVIQKKIAEHTINVGVTVRFETATNNAEWIRVEVLRSAHIASTTDGRYYVRVHDSCVPIPPDEMSRLAADKNAFVWEEQTTRKVTVSHVDEQKRNTFLHNIRNSQRVSSFVTVHGIHPHVEP